MGYVGQKQAHPIAFANAHRLQTMRHAPYTFAAFRIAVPATQEIEKHRVRVTVCALKKHFRQGQGREVLVPPNRMVVFLSPDYRVVLHDNGRKVTAQMKQHAWKRWDGNRSEEHTSELQSLMRISYAVFCLKKKKNIEQTRNTNKK